jgi:hypothetical protein
LHLNPIEDFSDDEEACTLFFNESYRAVFSLDSVFMQPLKQRKL